MRNSWPSIPNTKTWRDEQDLMARRVSDGVADHAGTARAAVAK